MEENEQLIVPNAASLNTKLGNKPEDELNIGIWRYVNKQVDSEGYYFIKITNNNGVTSRIAAQFRSLDEAVMFIKTTYASARWNLQIKYSSRA